MRKSLIAFALAAAGAACAQDAASASQDISGYSLAGTKATMTAAEAENALRKYCTLKNVNKISAHFVDKTKSRSITDPDDNQKTEYERAKMPLVDEDTCIWYDSEQKSAGVIVLNTLDGKYISAIEMESIKSEKGQSDADAANAAIDAEIKAHGEPAIVLRPKDGIQYYVDDENREFYGLTTKEDNLEHPNIAVACWGECRLHDDGKWVATGATGYWISIAQKNDELVVVRMLADEKAYIEMVKKFRQQ